MTVILCTVSQCIFIQKQLEERVEFQYVASAAEAGIDFSKWNLLSYCFENVQFDNFSLPGLQLQTVKLYPYFGW